ncbi:MAG: MBOAT family protein [Candidatus Omnitrophica bacterium]|nr:MBOAT family protein [Candidatus Omnitrophota bacterium]
MLFNSFPFLIFFIVVYSLYLALNHKRQNRMLLVASYVFYGSWDWRFLSLIWISTILDYVCGAKIYGSNDLKIKKLFLFFSIFGNLTILGVFKYFNFFASSLQSLLAFFGVSVQPHFLSIILPIGISFYTFQTMSYTIDIYRNEMQPTKKFLDFSLFVAFFPQLVAGPIERAKNLIPQILKPRQIKEEDFLIGCRLILWGLFKKVVVADRLGIYVDAVYGNVYHHSSLTFVLATFFFAFQIYCDFSGYSSMARGLARLMGFHIMVNFRSPYFSKNVREFWHRWHISFSTWLRDYVYIPLGGSRGGSAKTNRNILTTMLLGGLWHGANWTFVIWGALHGFYIIVTRFIQEKLRFTINIYKQNSAFLKILNIAITFTIVLLTWVFFRAESLSQSAYILKSIFQFPVSIFLTGSLNCIVHGLAGIITVILFEYRARSNLEGDVLQFKPITLQWGVYYAIILSITLFGVYGGEQFIYFQF